MPMLSIRYACSCGRQEHLLIFADSNESKEKIQSLDQLCACGTVMNKTVKEEAKFLSLNGTHLALMGNTVFTFTDTEIHIYLDNLIASGFGGKVIVDYRYGNNDEVVYLVDPMFDKAKVVSKKKNITPDYRKRDLRLVNKDTVAVKKRVVKRTARTLTQEAPVMPERNVTPTPIGGERVELVTIEQMRAANFTNWGTTAPVFNGAINGRLREIIGTDTTQ